MLVVRPFRPPPRQTALSARRSPLMFFEGERERERGQRTISWISGFRSTAAAASAIFSDFPLGLLLLLSQPPFSSAKTSITAFSFFTPGPSLCSSVPRSLFPLLFSLFPPLSLSMWNNMSYAISMARLCYLWVWGKRPWKAVDGARKEGGIISGEG